MLPSPPRSLSGFIPLPLRTNSGLMCVCIIHSFIHLFFSFTDSSFWLVSSSLSLDLSLDLSLCGLVDITEPYYTVAWTLFGLWAGPAFQRSSWYLREEVNAIRLMQGRQPFPVSKTGWSAVWEDMVNQDPRLRAAVEANAGSKIISMDKDGNKTREVVLSKVKKDL